MQICNLTLLINKLIDRKGLEVRAKKETSIVQEVSLVRWHHPIKMKVRIAQEAELTSFFSVLTTKTLVKTTVLNVLTLAEEKETLQDSTAPQGLTKNPTVEEILQATRKAQEALNWNK